MLGVSFNAQFPGTVMHYHTWWLPIVRTTSCSSLTINLDEPFAKGLPLFDEWWECDTLSMRDNALLTVFLSPTTLNCPAASLYRGSLLYQFVEFPYSMALLLPLAYCHKKDNTCSKWLLRDLWHIACPLIPSFLPPFLSLTPWQSLIIQ